MEKKNIEHIKGEFNYPEHKHPHGVEDAKPNDSRIWVCTECPHFFTDEEIRNYINRDNTWGHPCKQHPCRKGQRCESHLEPFIPELPLYSDPPSPEMVCPEKPKIICLCGSTRFSEAFQKAQFDLTMAGIIVLTIGCNMKTDTELFKNYSEQELKDIKTRLDELHKRKIDLADEVLILNVGGYIGESTKSELEYARKHNKIIRFLEN